MLLVSKLVSPRFKACSIKSRIQYTLYAARLHSWGRIASRREARDTYSLYYIFYTPAILYLLYLKAGDTLLHRGQEMAATALVLAGEVDATDDSALPPRRIKVYDIQWCIQCKVK